ncbi:MAG: hypothetical protein AB9M53_06275 [Leptothrix sp. (in: b-proteobacteria)]
MNSPTGIHGVLVLWVPCGTDPLAVQRAARAFARIELADHKLLMVLHEHQANPHVHLSVRAESRKGKQLNSRKAHLARWRETFAEQFSTAPALMAVMVNGHLVRRLAEFAWDGTNGLCRKTWRSHGLHPDSSAITRMCGSTQKPPVDRIGRKSQHGSGRPQIRPEGSDEDCSAHHEFRA